MDDAARQGALTALCHLLQGAQIDGIRFGPILQLLIADHRRDKPPIQGQVCINLPPKWCVFASRKVSLLNFEGEIPQVPVEAQLRTLCGLRERTISGIELGWEYPHLILTLDDGQVLFLPAGFEYWEVIVAWAGPADTWLVVADPCGEVSVWTPAKGATAGGKPQV